MVMRNVGHVGGPLLLALASVIVGGLLCKIVHECGHALTAVVLGGRIESVRISLPLPSRPGFFRIRYSLPSSDWRNGLTDLMGTGATTILAYGLVLAVFLTRPPLWLRLAALSAAFVCAWDMFLYATLPLLGLRRFLILGGRHAEPVYGTELIGIPPWLFLSLLAVSFLVFHGLAGWVLRRMAQ
jgi:hypothetical protein